MCSSDPNVFRDVSIFFNFCQLCDQRPKISLRGVRVWSGGAFLPADSAARLVADATIGTDTRSFRVESSAPEPPREKSYVVEYAVDPHDGPPYTIRTTIYLRKVIPANWAPFAW